MQADQPPTKLQSLSDDEIKRATETIGSVPSVSIGLGLARELLGFYMNARKTLITLGQFVEMAHRNGGFNNLSIQAVKEYSNGVIDAQALCQSGDTLEAFAKAVDVSIDALNQKLAAVTGSPSSSDQSFLVSVRYTEPLPVSVLFGPWPSVQVADAAVNSLNDIPGLNMSWVQGGVMAWTAFNGKCSIVIEPYDKASVRVRVKHPSEIRELLTDLSIKFGEYAADLQAGRQDEHNESGKAA